jgi:hypothetical protein
MKARETDEEAETMQQYEDSQSDVVGSTLGDFMGDLKEQLEAKV